MKEKYRLVVRRRWRQGRKEMYADSVFVWEQKEDALACKRLLDGAEVSKFTDVTFEVFTESRPLVDEEEAT